jgi:hypothetical protein
LNAVIRLSIELTISTNPGQFQNAVLKRIREIVSPFSFIRLLVLNFGAKNNRPTIAVSADKIAQLFWSNIQPYSLMVALCDSALPSLLPEWIRATKAERCQSLILSKMVI